MTIVFEILKNTAYNEHIDRQIWHMGTILTCNSSFLIHVHFLQWTFNSTWFYGGEKRLKWERTKPSDVYASPVRMSTAFCWWCSGITSSLEWILVMIRPRFRFPFGCAHMPIRHMYRTIPPSTWKTFILTWWHYGIDAFLKDMIKLQISVRRRSNLKNFMLLTSMNPTGHDWRQDENKCLIYMRVLFFLLYWKSMRML